MCPTSNVHTGAAKSIKEHPIGLLRRLSFRVTVNTDNRLMSDVTLSSSSPPWCEAFGYGWSDIQWLTINAMKSAFAPFDERLELINTVIKPGFAAAMAPKSRPGLVRRAAADPRPSYVPTMALQRRQCPMAGPDLTCVASRTWRVRRFCSLRW